MERLAIYPGSFDPVTNGHLDIIERGLKLFDRVMVAVLINPAKKPLFSVEERVALLKESVRHLSHVEVSTSEGLLVDYAARNNAVAILRGMRAVSDFEHEFQLALMNRKLNRKIETVFLMTGLRWIFTSSSIIKEAAIFGGQIKELVPEVVYERLKEKFELLGKAEP